MIDISIFSFFSGSGFLDLGFEDSKCNISFVNEYHTPFLEAYQYSRKMLEYTEPKYGYSNLSIEEYLTGKENRHLKEIIGKSKKNELVGFIGGPPCPDFSVGGKNKGRHGDNGRLTGIYIELICSTKPDFFIFENVRGLWRTNRHREFYEEVKHTLANQDYLMSEQLVNSIEFGVPQDRDRIILFGINKQYLLNEKVIENFNWDLKKTHKREILALDWPNTNEFQAQIIKPKNLPIELMIDTWFKNNNVSNHPNSLDRFKPKAGLSKFLIIPEGDVSKKSYKRLHRYRYSPTVAYGNNEVHLHPTEPRRISVAEALAIQSLPDSFQLPPQMTLTNKFKTIGNGVPYLLGKGIAETINDFIYKNLRT